MIWGLAIKAVGWGLGFLKERGMAADALARAGIEANRDVSVAKIGAEVETTKAVAGTMGPAALVILIASPFVYYAWMLVLAQIPQFGLTVRALPPPFDALCVTVLTTLVGGGGLLYALRKR